MLPPPPGDTAAPADASRTSGLSAAPPFSVTVTRSDPEEIRKLRSRLLKLILENQVRRENERQLGGSMRGVC